MATTHPHPTHELLTHAGGILEIRLRRPPVNALDPDTVVWLAATIREAPAQGHKAIVLSGQPGMFTGGLDVPRLLALDEAAIARFFVDFFALLKAVAASEVPIAAALTGHAPAGGTVLAVLCDYRVMADGEYKMGFNEHLVGLPVPRPVFVAFERLSGHRVAALYAMQGRVFGAREAHTIGLIDELVAADQVVPRALEWCRSLLRLPAPKSVAQTRRYVRSGLLASFEAEQLDAGAFAREWMGPETQAALRAMVERVKKKT